MIGLAVYNIDPNDTISTIQPRKQTPKWKFIQIMLTPENIPLWKDPTLSQPRSLTVITGTSLSINQHLPVS